MNGLFSLVRLSRSQWWSAGELSARRDAALVKLVGHAYNRVPYYRALLDKSGVHPSDIKTASDLIRIPVTTKRDLQACSIGERTARMPRHAGCRPLRTSGATGTPLEVVLSSVDRGRVSSSFIRVYRAWGVRPSDRLLTFETRPQMLNHKSWYEWFGFLRRRRISALATPANWIHETRAWRPKLVQGNALTLKLFAMAVCQAGADVRVPLVVSTGGWLDTGGRRLLEETLHARVIDVYASVEGGVMAWECPTCGLYHVSDDFLLMELLREDRRVGPGEAGDVVITILNAYAMPLIRYQHGDLAVPSDEAPRCGRGLSLLKTVLGRSNDFILKPSGRRLSSHPLFVLMDTAEGVGEWQVVQQADYSLDVNVVSEKGAPDADRSGLMLRLKAMFGPEMTIRIHEVEAIQRDPTQKLRSIISHATGAKGNPDLPT